MISFREGDAHDIAGIMKVMNEAFDPAFGEAWTAAQCISALSLPANRLLLALNQATIVGFALSRWVLDEEELLMIAVAKGHQRKNIGNLLVKSITENAEVAGRRKLFLEVRDGNSAHLFYKSIEFQEIGRRRQYYRGEAGQAFDAISMAKTLS